MMGYSTTMSPESSSSTYPDRPILPLPKRRLRERLSAAVAESIKYPPAPQTTTPLFVYPYSSRDDNGTHSLGAAKNFVPWRGLESRAFVGGETRDDTPISQQRRSLPVRPAPEMANLGLRGQQRSLSSRHIPQAPPSTASSADGYDSFENSNNKKKRKIPTAGESILNGAHPLGDPGALGVPSPPTTSDEGSSEIAAAATAAYYQAGTAAVNGAGISGPGRGRYGRVRNGRSPLRVLSDPNSVWPGRAPKPKTAGQLPSSPPGENVGIISSAIASAEKNPRPHGQENVSLLQSKPYTVARNTPSAPTQFTFTFDSSSSVSWPGADLALDFPGYHHSIPRGMAGDNRDVYNNRNAQAPPMAGGAFSGGHGATKQGNNGHGKGPPSPNALPRKTKKRGNSLLLAARRRKQQTEDQNYHHPPAPEDIWMCEFCEYESIFGEAPTALIRQYEIKDRKRRREEAERRRLLEKAKMKSRKGKKPSKNPAKTNSNPSDQAAANTSAAQPTAKAPQDGTLDGVHEEYENGYYEDDVHDDDLPPLESFSQNPAQHRHAANVLGDGGGGLSGAMPQPLQTSA
ncbi:uncharacterized protein B0I36DRAFT_64643 [Microdochium trichocladiopsis]|uniref:Uncharacterized protein n=1 Tax=Microdochium trichocladiopsis TaxID=1682393 RepID=A0A9P8YDH7_9PEZI|nr:uncharacterized protein B0I36DRAFT_64643 [Microdochium trichocladiopsis]KAH7037338.1 hypothetical protein B0I36DRAFT_64643 [Microdochium trichocladiopsis]